MEDPKNCKKNSHLGTIAQLCWDISSQLRHVSTIGKNLLTAISPPHVPTIWWTNGWEPFGSLGYPANFNGFHVLPALLHGTLVVGISQTSWRWTEGATYFGRAAITFGIGPHCSYNTSFMSNLFSISIMFCDITSVWHQQQLYKLKLV